MALDRPPTQFPELNAVLADFVTSVREVLGANLVGVYLQGSFALGDADEYSDVDWVVVTNEDVADRLDELNAMHARLHARPEAWAQHLEGSYFPITILRDLHAAPSEIEGDPRPSDWVDPQTGAPATVYPLLFLNNGDTSLVRSQHDNTLVVRWVLREHGLGLFGPPPSTLIAPVDPDGLRAESLAVMRRFGASLLAAETQIDALWLQGFTVLFFCRALNAVSTGTIVSKPAAIEWAKGHVDPRWQPLIERAWAQRSRYPRGVGAPLLHASLKAEGNDLAETLEFVHYALSRHDSR
jgi:predicted nucleotidyltransferase